MPPLMGGDMGAIPRPTLLGPRGMGGGLRGFSKLSSLLRGKRGLAGGLSMEPYKPCVVGEAKPLGEEELACESCGRA